MYCRYCCISHPSLSLTPTLTAMPPMRPSLRPARTTFQRTYMPRTLYVAADCIPNPNPLVVSLVWPRRRWCRLSSSSTAFPCFCRSRSRTSATTATARGFSGRYVCTPPLFSCPPPPPRRDFHDFFSAPPPPALFFCLVCRALCILMCLPFVRMPSFSCVFRVFAGPCVGSVASRTIRPQATTRLRGTAHHLLPPQTPFPSPLS